MAASAIPTTNTQQCCLDKFSPHQDARFLNDFDITYDMGGSVVTANGLMLRAAFPILRDKAIKSLILPKTTEDTIKILLSLAYTGRLVILIYNLRHRLQHSCYSSTDSCSYLHLISVPHS